MPLPLREETDAAIVELSGTLETYPKACTVGYSISYCWKGKPTLFEKKKIVVINWYQVTCS